MDFLKDDVRRLYRQFLVPSVGSALVISVYSSVDTIAVGQAEGELGTAAMAVVAPLYSFFIFLAILCGVGGSVLMSNAKSRRGVRGRVGHGLSNRNGFPPTAKRRHKAFICTNVPHCLLPISKFFAILHISKKIRRTTWQKRRTTAMNPSVL